MSTSKNGSSKIKGTFDQNFQFFGPYYAGTFNTSPNAAQKRLEPLKVVLKGPIWYYICINYRKPNHRVQKIYYNRHKQNTYIKNSRSGTLIRTYSEHSQTSKMEIFAEIVNVLKPLTISAKNFILKV